MRRVLFVEATHVEVGGVGSRQARLAASLPAHRWQATIALTRGARFHDPERYRRHLPALDYVELDARTGSNEGRRLAIVDAIRRIQPDVVLPGAVLDAWYVAEEMKPQGGPRIVYAMTGVDLNASSFVARHAGAVDAAFGVSPLTAGLLHEFSGIPQDRVFLVPTGVRPALQASSQTVHTPIRLLYVGRFDRDKRVLDALSLADELTSRGVPFHLTLVGSGTLRAEVENAAARHPNTVSVVAPVPQSTLYDRIYPDADAILLFSPVEGLPNSLLEGMAHGLIPITSDFRGRHELGLLRDRETALVFDVGDIRGAADRVADVIRDPALKRTLGEAARTLVETERSIDAMTAGFVRVLERALSDPPRLDYPPAPPLEGRSRLRRVVGPVVAERIRRLLGRSFHHPDASEWPSIDNAVPPNREGEENRLRSAIEKLGQEMAGPRDGAK